MKSGPDLDALVAEKVMDCKVQRRTIIQHYKEDGVEKKRDATGYSCGCPRENESFAPHGREPTLELGDSVEDFPRCGNVGTVLREPPI